MKDEKMEYEKELEKLDLSMDDIAKWINERTDTDPMIKAIDILIEALTAKLVQQDDDLKFLKAIIDELAPGAL